MYIQFYLMLIVCTKFCATTSQFYRSYPAHKYHFITSKDDRFASKTSTMPTPITTTVHSDHKFRHSNRYNKIDKLLYRMQNFDSTTTVAPIITTERRLTNHHYWGDRNYNNGNKDYRKITNDHFDKLKKSNKKFDAPIGGASFDEYEDIIEDDADMESDSNDYEFTDNYDQDYNDNDDYYNTENNWQAEDSNRDYTNNRVHSRFTDVKWERYGTPEKVAQTRETYYKKGGSYQQLRNEADMHMLRMNNEGACKIPRSRVISVQTIHPDPSRIYVPSCTILHRCADDTGCCDGQGTCTVKKEETVKLYFHIINLNSNKTIELLKFENHTECECKFSKYDSVESDTEGIARRDISEDYEDTDPQELIQKCTCPSDYTPEMNSINCQCVCKSDKCNQRNVGKEHFSYKDRTCIQMKNCERPFCLHGAYISAIGICPKKEDKIRLYSNISNRTTHTHKKRNKY